MTGPFFLCTAALTLIACHRAEAPMPDFFPETTGAWHRTALRDMRAAEAPDAIPQASIERLRAASYEGPGKLYARVYQMSSPEVALDVAQSWRAAPDTVYFNGGRFFVVVQWESAERKALHEFVSGMEKKLNAKR